MKDKKTICIPQKFCEKQILDIEGIESTKVKNFRPGDKKKIIISECCDLNLWISRKLIFY